jgi:hypothetical protein
LPVGLHRSILHDSRCEQPPPGLERHLPGTSLVATTVAASVGALRRSELWTKLDLWWTRLAVLAPPDHALAEMSVRRPLGTVPAPKVNGEMTHVAMGVVMRQPTLRSTRPIAPMRRRGSSGD